MNSDATIATFFLGIIFYLVIVWPVEAISCHSRYSSFPGVEYGLISGCRVIQDSKLVPVENLRIFEGK